MHLTSHVSTLLSFQEGKTRKGKNININDSKRKDRISQFGGRDHRKKQRLIDLSKAKFLKGKIHFQRTSLHLF